LQHISQILQVPVPFFFEGGPAAPGLEPAAGETDFPASYVTDFLATSSKTRNCVARLFGLLRRSRRRRYERTSPCFRECQIEGWSRG
jgi:hypothetical protein